MNLTRTGLLTALMWLLGGVLAVTAAAAAAPTDQVVMDLPTTGPLAGVAQVAYQALQRSYDVWWLREHEPQQRERKVAVVLLHTSAPLQASMAAALAEHVQQGGGLVFIMDSDRDRLAENREQLAALGVKVHLGSDETVAVQVRDHPITSGVGNLGLVRAELTLGAGDATVLATQSARPLAVAGTLGQGRFVVLLDNLVCGAGAVTESSPAARLLLQAVEWAAGQGAGQPTALKVPEQPSAPATLPTVAGKVLVDLAGTKDRWPQIRTAVEGVLDASGLTREAFSYTKDTGTLAQALAANPALVVVGAVRRYDEPEAAALSEYLWNGGALLALGYATSGTIADLQALNRLLTEAGVGVTFARAAGQAVPLANTLTAGVQGWGRVPEGVAIWALGDQPLVNVGSSAVLVTHEYGQGRLVVCDGLALAPNTAAKTPADDSSPAFREVLARCVRWLVGKREP